MTPGVLTWPDYLVLALGLGLVLGIGAALRGRQTDTTEFFLAGRHVPWWAACLSFLATEISALTIVGVPATACNEGNWEYLQYFIGSSASKLVVAFLFIPAFYALRVTTIYELLLDRFGRRTQVAASIFFFVTRLLGSGVRLMAAAVAVSILLGLDPLLTIGVFTLVSIAYIAAGGVSAIVWTNVVQALVFIAAGVAALLFALASVDGGLSRAWALTWEAGRMRVFDWGPSPWEPGFLGQVFTRQNVWWVAILNGFFGSLAAFGTDHDLMQRLIAVETRRQSQLTLCLSPLLTLVVVLLFLSLGSALHAFLVGHPLAIEKPDQVLAVFARDVMPAGLKGLVLTAIVLASLDSPLGALAASFVTDIYRPLIAPDRPDGHYLRVGRVCVLAFGLALAALAVWFSFFEGILWLAFKIAGVTFGSLLGVFLLALLARRPTDDRANVVAMVAMAAVNLALLVLSEKAILPLAWPWLVLIGTAGTVALARALTPLLAPRT